MARPQPARYRNARSILNRITRTKRLHSLLPDALQEQKRSLQQTAIGMFIVAGILAFYFFVLQSPELYVGMTEKAYGQRLALKEHLDAINAIRVTMLSLFSGLAVLGGAYLTLRNVSAAEKNVKLAQEGQITDRFIKAVEKLGSDKLEMRLGGIYALERIAKDSERDHWPVMEILSAFVRENAKWDAAASNPDASTSPSGQTRTDIHAIITVLRRRRWQCETSGQHLDLRATDLRGVDLSKAYLRQAKLSGSCLDGANLVGVDLEEADLQNCRICNAEMTEAFLQNADLTGVIMRNTDISHSVLRQANLQSAEIEGVNAIEVEAESACFQKAAIRGADFGRSNFRYANFSRAEVNDVSFHRTHLEWAKFTGATLESTALKQAFTEGIEGVEPSESAAQAAFQPATDVSSNTGTSNTPEQVVIGSKR